MLIRFHHLILAFSCLVANAGLAVADKPQLERWDRAVCLQSPPADATQKGPLASAFVVSADENLFVITAAHAAEQTDKRTRLLYRSIDGESQWVSLGVIMPIGSNPWIRHKNSDVAVAKITAEASCPYLKMLADIAVPIGDISTKTIGRTTKIEIAGFPFGLGIQEQVSSIVVAGTVASNEIRTENDWGNEPLIYCSPDLAQGTSGGPAFLAVDDSRSVTVVGMYVGVIYDASGGKLSKCVPSRIIHEAIVAQGKDG